MRLRHFILLNLLIMICSASSAQMPAEQVPEPLKPWIGWALHDVQNNNCPYLYNGQQRACSWPSKLELQLSNSGGTFSQSWQIFDETLVQLPGDNEHWPQRVQSQAGELLVESKGGMPFVRLTAGTHTLQGLFRWSKLPKAIKVTPETGMVNLSINNKAIDRPQFNQQGQLWLTQGVIETANEDNLDIQVFRKLTDSHPVQVVTSIKLRVSGKQRNTNLAPVLLKGFIPLTVKSPLPARFESTEGENKQLQVQLRPGEWTIEVTGRAYSDETAFTLPTSQMPWPQQEVWVFSADNKIRQVEVRGASSIDPSQTRLPAQWKSLPAYLMLPEQTLNLEVMHRGVSQTGQNDLSLNREMWLDYDGKGYTIKDRLTGVLRQTSRLNVNAALNLGRVSIDGQDQFITLHKPKDASDSAEANAGIEIRRESINLIAESRFTGDRSRPPVNGWDHDLQNVNTTLHLPPGWRLLSTSGTDNLPRSWVQQWSLLDFFLVLIISMSVAYLFNPVWAVFTLITLVLTWHEPDAPRYIWLSLLAAIALLRVLPEGWFKRAVSTYRWLSVLALALIMLPYMIDTIRGSLYPQLETGIHRSVSFDRDTRQMRDVDVAMEESMVMENSAQASRPKLSSKIVAKAYLGKQAPQAMRQQAAKADLNAIDPNSMIQTGPGLPNWRAYRAVRLQWSGPVKADETSHLVLINPLLNRLFKFLGIAMLLGLSWRLISLSEHLNDLLKRGFKQWFKKGAAPIAAAFILPFVLFSTETVEADSFPDKAMLETLKQRLMSPPQCLPECAQIEQMQVSIDENNLQARLRVHAVIDTAIPLPGSQSTWLSSTVILNDEPALAVKRDNSQQLWIAIPKGLHTILLSGALPKRNSLPLPLPLKPHSVTWQSNDPQWELEGIKDNGSAETQLQLNRMLSKDAKAVQEETQSTLPNFVKVERHLNLGLDWTVETTVTRLSPLGSPLSINIPLLNNEQPMSEQLSIKAGQIKINLNANQRQSRWSSRLDASNELVLNATDRSDLLEIWQVATSPVWHLDSSGIPVNQYKNQGRQTVPVWYPWPNETLSLRLSRPEGIEGQTVTILSSNVQIDTGKRANTIKLDLDILSSRGVQHEIKLPKNATLKQVRIDGERQRTEITENKLSLTLKPGKQRVNIEWSESEILSSRYQFPAIDLGLASVNANFNISLPKERWVLWVTGPSMGPAVLFWGVLLALLLLSIILGASKLTPLASWQWFLLGIGLSQTETALMVLVIVWLFAIAFREKLTGQFSYAKFNAMQISLVCLTIVSLLVLAAAVANGLLGSPDMQIVGNGSNAYALNWYQDRADQLLPQPSLLSVPLWIYRALMLIWALWLAISVLGWLRWGWDALNVGGLWIKRPPKKPTKDKAQ